MQTLKKVIGNRESINNIMPRSFENERGRYKHDDYYFTF